MEFRRLASQDETTRYQVEVSNADIAMLQSNVVPQLLDKMAKGLADDFIKEHGAEIVSKIDLKLVTNLAVAEVVKRIGGELRR